LRPSAVAEKAIETLVRSPPVVVAATFRAPNLSYKTL
jgi:hypothetical protein